MLLSTCALRLSQILRPQPGLSEVLGTDSLPGQSRPAASGVRLRAAPALLARSPPSPAPGAAVCRCGCLDPQSLCWAARCGGGGGGAL